jgi:hypothetical protein
LRTDDSSEASSHNFGLKLRGNSENIEKVMLWLFSASDALKSVTKVPTAEFSAIVKGSVEKI